MKRTYIQHKELCEDINDYSNDEDANLILSKQLRVQDPILPVGNDNNNIPTGNNDTNINTNNNNNNLMTGFLVPLDTNLVGHQMMICTQPIHLETLMNEKIQIILRICCVDIQLLQIISNANRATNVTGLKVYGHYGGNYNKISSFNYIKLF